MREGYDKIYEWATAYPSREISVGDAIILTETGFRLRLEFDASNAVKGLWETPGAIWRYQIRSEIALL